jgi:hypothetical protein
MGAGAKRYPWADFRRFCLPLLQGRTTAALKVLFGCVLAFRFLYPFYHNPVRQLWSDPGRHWDDGASLLNPTFLSGLEAKTYQVWVYILRHLPGTGDDSMIALMTGLLCAAMAYFWYRALKEICSENAALALSILIGLHPSLTAIYGYFMIETFALTGTALTVWLTLRGLRLRTHSSYVLAVLAGLLTTFSKYMIMPLMALPFFCLFLEQKDKVRAAAWAAILFAALAIPATLHTLKGMNIFSLFGGSIILNTISHDSGYTGLSIDIYNAKGRWHYAWGSSSYNINPLDPLSQYTSYRAKGIYAVAPVNLDAGEAAWDKELAIAAAGHTLRANLLDLRDNFVYLFFGPSWPDADKDGEIYRRLNWHLRWLWAPCLFFVLCLAPFARMRREHMIFVLATCFMVALMLVQQIGTMEGRYRKPIEPFIILSVAFIASALIGRRDPHAVTMPEFMAGLTIKTAGIWRRGASEA